MKLGVILAAALLCANAPKELPELSFFERAELPEAELLNARELGSQLQLQIPMSRNFQDWHGEVEISVIVTREGSAAHCQVRKSSGKAMIDKWACNGTERYARFAPATNDKNEPVLSQWTDTITLSIGRSVSDPIEAKP